VLYVPDPPVGAAVKVTDCPTSAGSYVTVGEGTNSAGLTVSARVAVAVLVNESVTARVTLKGVLLVEEGVQLIEAEFEDEQPGGRFVQT
jgi:hypothetical protein